MNMYFWQSSWNLYYVEISISCFNFFFLPCTWSADVWITWGESPGRLLILCIKKINLLSRMTTMRCPTSVLGTTKTPHGRATLAARPTRPTADRRRPLAVCVVLLTAMHAFILTPIPKLFHNICNIKIIEITARVFNISKKKNSIKLLWCSIIVDVLVFILISSLIYTLIINHQMNSLFIFFMHYIYIF